MGRDHPGHVCIGARARPQPAFHPSCSPHHVSQGQGRADPTPLGAGAGAAGWWSGYTGGRARCVHGTGSLTPRHAGREGQGKYHPHVTMGEEGRTPKPLPAAALSPSAETLWAQQLQGGAEALDCHQVPLPWLWGASLQHPVAAPAEGVMTSSGLLAPSTHSTALASRDTQLRGPTQLGDRRGTRPSKSLLVPWHGTGAGTGFSLVT